jgi:hypothetical protein
MLTWLTSLGSWVANPAILATGALLVAAPIIIHLLNRRRFKVVDWAAMDFLLEADRRNRRRVRLENLIVLLLRCLAVLLLGLLLARPFDSSGLLAKLTGAQQIEHILIVDDSVSMQALVKNETAMEEARRRMVDLVRSLAIQRSKQTITVVRSSRPTERLFQGSDLVPESVDDIAAELQRIEATDLDCSLSTAIDEVERVTAGQPPTVNRLVYVITDLRRRDWNPTANNETSAPKDAEATKDTSTAGPANGDSALASLRKLAKVVKSCYVVDVGAGDDSNLTIESIRSEQSLVAGVESRFEVTVKNQGSKSIEGVKVKFTPEGSIGVTRDLDVIGAGESEVLSFSHAFPAPSESDLEERRAIPPARVKVEVAAEQGPVDDRLAADSTGYFAARLSPGIPVLIIDGDPAAGFGKAESYYLTHALAPRGKYATGIVVDVVTESELESVDFKQYQVVFVCNVYRFSNDKTIDALTEWTKAGGAVVFMPGDQTDESWFNGHLYGEGDKAGTGLSPARLVRVDGVESPEDASLDSWANLRIDDPSHPVVVAFAGQQNPLLSNVKIFRWWKVEPGQAVGSPAAATLIKLTDAEESPFLVERPLGRGRTLLFTGPGDADWSNWPSNPSFFLIAQELVRYAAPGDAAQGKLAVGQPVKETVDISQYEVDAVVNTPHRGKQSVAIKEPGNAAAGSKWQLEFTDTQRAGFYEAVLEPRPTVATEAKHVLFAANVAPTDGSLVRVEPDTLQRAVADAGIKVLAGGTGGVDGFRAQTEIWRFVLWGLVLVLLGEQLLAWIFGWGR